MQKVNWWTRLGNYLATNFYSVLLAVMLFLNTMPIIAPILASLGLNLPANAIYSLYSMFCHQLHWRSFHVCDHQYGWCSRCTAIWLNVLLTGIFVKFFKVKEIKWYWILVLILPMSLDGIVQTIATLVGFASTGEIYYMSNNLVRSLTGTLFGIGFGLWVWTTIADSLPKKQQEKRTKEISLVKITIYSILISFILFILALVLWQITSPNNQPANFWDFAVKTPTLPQEFLLRAKNAVN